MGCWMQTCAVTRTAIRDGDPCRLVLLGRKNHYRRSISNTHDLYAVIEVPFRGLYDDDEGFIVFEDPLELERFHAVARELGFDVDNIEEMSQYDKRMSEGHDHRDCEINYCLVSETVFEHFSVEFQDICEDLNTVIKPLYLRLVADLENDSDPESSLYSSIVAKNPAHVIERLVHAEPGADYRHMTRRFLNFGWGAGSHMHYLWPMFPAGCDPFERIIGLAELFLVNDFLSNIRGMWSPQSGQGSYDDNDSNQYNRLIKMIDERISRDFD